MIEQMGDRDCLAVGWVVGQVGSDWLIEAQLALLLQQHNGRSGELLGNGGEAKDCIGSDSAIPFYIGEAIARDMYRLAILDDSNSYSRSLRVNLVSNDLVDFSNHGFFPFC